jgi:hypothetical protein
MHINVIVLNARHDTVIAFMQSNKPMNSDGFEIQFHFVVVVFGIAGLLQLTFASSCDRINK